MATDSIDHARQDGVVQDDEASLTKQLTALQKHLDQICTAKEIAGPDRRRRIR